MSRDLSYTEEERARWHGRHQAKPLDLGSGVRAEFTTMYSDPTDAKAGLILSHIHDDGLVCESSVTFDVPAAAAVTHAKWRVVSLDPLHIEPSVLVRPCGLHGFIREGRWVPA